MTSFTRDPEFVEAVRQIFGDAADKMLANENVVLQLEQIWLRAIWRERERVWTYLSRKDVEKAFDEGRLTGQLRTIIGNGTYLDTEPDTTILPPWAQQDNILELRMERAGDWTVYLNGQKPLAKIKKQTLSKATEPPYVAQLLEDHNTVVDEKRFSTHVKALEWVEEAVVLLSKVLGVVLYKRQATADLWEIEDTNMKSLGKIRRLEAGLWESQVSGLEGAKHWDDFDQALKWIRTKASQVQKRTKRSKKTA